MFLSGTLKTLVTYYFFYKWCVIYQFSLCYVLCSLIVQYAANCFLIVYYLDFFYIMSRKRHSKKSFKCITLLHVIVGSFECCFIFKTNFRRIIQACIDTFKGYLHFCSFLHSVLLLQIWLDAATKLHSVEQHGPCVGLQHRLVYIFLDIKMYR